MSSWTPILRHCGGVISDPNNYIANFPSPENEGEGGGVLKAVWIFSVFRSIPIRNISLGSSFLGTFP